MTEFHPKDHPAFAHTAPEKLAIIETLLEKCQGKTLKESVLPLNEAMATLKKQGLSFTSEETLSIIALLSRDLPPEQQTILEKLREKFH